ncbi:MAG TPA: energy-coupling factor ABC transporter ATP-binding protein [Burkholderiales bacterium]|jgi:tungstate transport system ATP-binding protein|nr:energy-coupling factor ABC transporter ATP-binding protein [Burkholderiales bacterium]
MTVLVLELKSITKNFPQRELLRGVDLALNSGNSYVLTGDNGCGKTTLMRIIAGLEPADGGAMRFEGMEVDLDRYPEALRQRMTYVHQQPYLFHTSIAHNIAYGLKTRGVRRQQREKLIADAIAWAGVAHLRDVAPHKLSGGERQRVALARAKVLNSHLLLFDEPTANLDSEARRHAIDLIDELRGGDVTVLIACHDREIIDMPGMKRLRLASGRVAAV